MTLEQTRRERPAIIKRSLESAKDPDIEKLIVKGCMEWGVSKRTMREYVDIVLEYLK